jgi:hypothetical protein
VLPPLQVGLGLDRGRHKLLERANNGRAPMCRITLADALTEDRDHARRNSDLATKRRDGRPR